MSKRNKEYQCIFKKGSLKESADNRSKSSHQIIALIFLCIFGQTLFPYNQLWANNNGPIAPEAVSFEPVDASDMVNLLTGDVSYVLPLLNVPSPEGGYPLALSYHAGVAMNQEASWVGLGWNINPGAINRTVSGVPDDWSNIRKYVSVYDKGGTSTTYSGSVSVGFGEGLYSAGIYASYTENKAANGENSYRTDVGVTGSIGIEGSDFGVSGRVGTDGVGLGVAYSPGRTANQTSNTSPTAPSNFNTANGQSFIDGSTAESVSTQTTGSKLKGLSGGVSFNSKGGVGLSTNLGSFNLSGSGTIDTRISVLKSGWSVIIPFGYGTATASKQKTTYWLYDNNYSIFNGSLYIGNTKKSMMETNFSSKVTTDSYESVYKVNRVKELEQGNFTYTAYDNYTVSGQGISGSMKPYILQHNILKNQTQSLANDKYGLTTKVLSYRYPLDAKGDGKKSFDKVKNGVHFYFENENSSFLRIENAGWPTLNSNTSISKISDLTPRLQRMNTTLVKNGKLYNGYNIQNKRLRQGSFIETFTNKEIVSNPNLIASPIGFDRSDASLLPPQGIGAYRITTTDGKTYHYSIPVYQREHFSRVTELNSDINLSFREESQFEPYATHWLLTAVTGPDYVDTNSNNVQDDEDFGYWVSFEYGKWSDGFGWRTPTEGFEVDATTKSYEWGVKDIYYLDKIKTRTHTALFVKSLRSDDYSSSSSIAIGSKEQPKVFRDLSIKSYIGSDNGAVYLNGIYDDYLIKGNASDIGKRVESNHSVYFEVKQQPSLKLDRIILLKNSDPLSKLSKSRRNTARNLEQEGGEINISTRFVEYAGNGALVSEKPKPVHQRKWKARYLRNVLDKDDILTSDKIDKKAIKIIEFATNNDLAKGSPVREGVQRGKLSLKAVRMKGKGGEITVPDYKFDYYGKKYSYDNDQKDDWGYYKNQPDTWSLSEIKTPLGAKLQFDYEEDTYQQEAAQISYYFDRNLQVRFLGSESGTKQVQFRNHYDLPEKETIDFREYFEVDKVAKIDVQFWRNPKGGRKTHRIADIAKNCIVLEVQENTVVFEIPVSSSNGNVRRGSSCKADNWTHYKNYNKIVARTAGYYSALREKNCGEPGDDNNKVRYGIYSNRTVQKLNNGGGIRAKEIRVVAENQIKSRTTYQYNVPGTNRSSGITSYAPSKKNKQVSHISDIPGPFVMYKYITTSNSTRTNKLISKEVYNFKVLETMEIGSFGMRIGDIITKPICANQNTQIKLAGNTTDISLKKCDLIDNTASLGRLISKTSYNSKNQIIGLIQHEYVSPSESSQGILKESYSSYKRITANSNPEYKLVTSSKAKLPNILKSTRTLSGNEVFTTIYDEYDFLTGAVISHHSSNAKQDIIRNIVVPAYSKYSRMGSKSDNPGNKNMLNQKAASYAYVQHKGSTKQELLDASISTWDSKPGTNIWLRKADYLWKGPTTTMGTYSQFKPFAWNSTTQNKGWLKVRETTKYDDYSMPLENLNINDYYQATKMGDNGTKIYATANARYTEMYYTGMETRSNKPSEFEGDISTSPLELPKTIFSQKSHTGKFSLIIRTSNALEVILKKNEHRKGRYKISVWVDKGSETKARVKIDGISKMFNGEKITAGDWVLLNHYEDFNANAEYIVAIHSSNGSLLADDYRLHPVESKMTSYVYNETGELTYILGANNLATKYEYDSAGKLRTSSAEYIDEGDNLGGFKPTQEIRYNQLSF